MPVSSLRLEPCGGTVLGAPIGQLRARPVRMGRAHPEAILIAWSSDFDIDPYVEMFYFPKDTLKLALLDLNGSILWQKDLGPGVVPGMYFVPIHACDLDGDGYDEIWFVNNVNTAHPLSLNGYRLERLSAQTGETTGQWEWPASHRSQALSYTFRNFIFHGIVRGEPVLVTAQGTYENMHLQGWDRDMTRRWTHDIAPDSPGARGSHMVPVADINNDGIDEVMWGERCIELDTGRELWCADRDTYRGHSDIIAPTLDLETGKWFVYTCRESDPGAAPRVAFYDAAGARVWGALDAGHIDMGWVARLGDTGKTAMAICIGAKTCGPDGRHHQAMESFAFDAYTGEPAGIAFDPYGTLPVDLNGDGRHEIVRGLAVGDNPGDVLDRYGAPAGQVNGRVALARKMGDYPGEQILVYSPDGEVSLTRDAAAKDSDEALARYANPYYRTCRDGGVLLGGL
ncbi:MAG: hypothetical protein GF418_07485 [Chitinivibrionales bacterium]|nr:hypothetical protein [Chitinivibrionales bacterium]MBD3395454.1 hypothetical protein [Chitinivibrionales bacterium]